jgi:membrane-associated protease RseP (regulator of RpoE activity)
MLKYSLHRVWCYVAGILVLGATVAIHEAGHWGAAELCGAHCSTFNLGFGPGLQVGTIGGTEIWLRSLPFGGSVELPVETTETTTGLGDLSSLQRIFIFGAGILCNFVSAAVVLGYIIATGRAKNPGEFLREFLLETAIETSKKDAKFKLERLMFLGARAHRVIKNVLNYCAGAANIFTWLSEGALFGWRGSLKQAAGFSIALGIANIIPIAPLDGARMYDAFYGGVFSGSSPSGTATPAQDYTLNLGLALIIGPLIVGLMPGIIMGWRFESGLYRAIRRLKEVKVSIKMEVGPLNSSE